MGKIIDYSNIVGNKYGRLLVIEVIKNGSPLKVKVKCECSTEFTVLAYSVVSGNTKSCGCLQIYLASESNKTHGISGHPLLAIREAMIARCTNPIHKYKHRYIEKGITVCDQWLYDCMAFVNWALENGWKKGLELDRIDNSKGYYPDNCRFTTRKVNCRNKDNNIRISYNGNNLTLVEWAEKYNLHYHRLYDRINKLKWSFERAISTPTNKPFDPRDRGKCQSK